MAVKATLKFPGNLPWELEHKLVTKLGFVVKQRAGREWVIVEKQKRAWNPELLVNGELPPEVQQELIRRCNKIVDLFVDPECHTRVIRIRLKNYSMTLPPLQKQFVLDWADRNCLEDQ